MEIKMLSTFEKAKEYLKAAEQNGFGKQNLWQKYMIDPFLGRNFSMGSI